MIEDYALLDKLFSFLDHPSQNDAMKNGYFSKIVLTVYEKFPAELFLYFSIKVRAERKMSCAVLVAKKRSSGCDGEEVLRQH